MSSTPTSSIMFSCSSTICGSRCSSVHSSRCNRDTCQVTCCALLISWLSSSHTLSHCPKAGRTCIIFQVGPPYACGAPQQWVSALKTALLPVKGSAHRTAGTCSHYNACFFCIQNWYATIFSPQHLSYMFSHHQVFSIFILQILGHHDYIALYVLSCLLQLLSCITCPQC